MSQVTQPHCPQCQHNVSVAEEAEQTINTMDQDIADLTASCNVLKIENERLQARVAEFESMQGCEVP